MNKSLLCLALVATLIGLTTAAEQHSTEDGKYKITWDIEGEGENRVLALTVEAETTGWVGFGLNKDANAMLGAELVMAGLRLPTTTPPPVTTTPAPDSTTEGPQTSTDAPPPDTTTEDSSDSPAPTTEAPTTEAATTEAATTEAATTEAATTEEATTEDVAEGSIAVHKYGKYRRSVRQGEAETEVYLSVFKGIENAGNPHAREPIADHSWTTVAASFKQEEGKTTIVLKRPLVVDVADGKGVVNIEDSNLFVLWSYGATDDFSRHTAMGDFRLNLINPDHGGHESASSPLQVSIVTLLATIAAIRLF